MEWINVKDKLPSHGDIVLVYKKGCDFGLVAWFDCNNEYDYLFMNADKMCEQFEKIDYWMPFPELPKDY